MAPMSNTTTDRNFDAACRSTARRIRPAVCDVLQVKDFSSVPVTAIYDAAVDEAYERLLDEDFASLHFDCTFDWTEAQEASHDVADVFCGMFA